MIVTALLAVGLMILLTRLAKRSPRWRFVEQAAYTVGLLWLNVGWDSTAVRILALLCWPMQVRDLRRAGRLSGVECWIRRKHLEGERMLVDASGRRVGGLICTDPAHNHRLPDGVTALPGACRRCGRSVA